MKNSILKILGLVFIILGIAGFLLFGTNILGYVISNEDNKKLEFLKIDDITIKAGDSKTIDLEIKNNWQEAVTNCELLISGEKRDWITNKDSKNIEANTNTNFNLKILIPSETPIDDYPINLKLTCDQETISTLTSISVTKGVDAIKIREMKSEKEFLNVIYTFDNKGFIGDSTYVEIWVNNPDGFEINRIKDQFSIKTDSLIVRDVKINLKENPKGVYAVFFSHPSDSENYIKKSIILGKSKTSGNAVFNVVEGKGLPYLSFLLFIAIGIFFIFRSHRRSVREANEPISTSPKLRVIR